MGAHTRALDTALRVAERARRAGRLHTDGLNECLSVEDTLAVLDGRTIHAFHIEGCGGGHVPNVLKCRRAERHRLLHQPDAALRPRRLAEHFGMIVSAHD